jgi:transposase
VALKQQNSVFIDPENCGSSVGYYITIGEHHNPKTEKDVHLLYATVVLTDCNHKIVWSFSGNGETDKIDSAISMLQEFRKKYIETEKLVAKLNK